MTTKFQMKRILTEGLPSLNNYTLSRYFVEHPTDIFEVELADGIVHLKGAWMFFHVHLWKPLVRRGLPVLKKHLVRGTMFTSSEERRIRHEIYLDVMAVNPQDERILYDLFDVINDLYNAAVYHLGSFQQTVSAYELCDLLDEPEIAPFAEIELTQAEVNGGVQAIQTRIKDTGKKMMHLLSTRPELKGNCLYEHLKLGILKTAQLEKLICCVGYRTDVDDTMIQYPILPSYFNGLRSAVEFGIEALSAKKTIIYNKYGMDKAQYDNRKLQLLTTSNGYSYIYPGDCGSTVLIPFDITRDNHVFMIGKNYVDAAGVLRTITYENVKSHIGSTLNLRSETTCRHRDGVCYVCGGHLLDYIKDTVALGQASVIELASPVSQLILSNKHLGVIIAQSYVIPTELRDIFFVNRDNIFFQRMLNVEDTIIGFTRDAMPRIDDLAHISKPEQLSEQHFGDLSELVIGSVTAGRRNAKSCLMMDEDLMTPYFTTDFLFYLKLHPEMIQREGSMIWVKLEKFDRLKPIMRASVKNDSMIEFVKDVKKFFQTNIKTYTSIPQALKDASALVHRRVKTNFMHLETIIRASLITDLIDYQIPVVTDANNVKFGTLTEIIHRRSLGTQLAFERQKEFLSDPTTYVLRRPDGYYDLNLGMDR